MGHCGLVHQPSGPGAPWCAEHHNAPRCTMVCSTPLCTTVHHGLQCTMVHHGVQCTMVLYSPFLSCSPRLLGKSDLRIMKPIKAPAGAAASSHIRTSRKIWTTAPRIPPRLHPTVGRGNHCFLSSLDIPVLYIFYGTVRDSELLIILMFP